MKQSFKNKKIFKHLYKKCAICNESRFELLDVHRWKIEGKNGGKYTFNNCICVCSTCHRLIHAKKIIILGIYNSTSGKVINYKNEKGENFKNI